MSQNWWLPPRLHRTLKEEREESWLELFYDLVYVAVLIQLGNRLSDDTSLIGIAIFIGLFLPIWWSWTGITFYINRFVVDDIPHRLLIFVQIFFLAVLGTTLDGVFATETDSFILAWVAVRVILILLYVRTRKHEPEAWPLVRRYVIGFSIAAAIWLSALLFPTPLLYVVCGIAMFCDFATPLLPESRRRQTLLPPDDEHMQGRYGTFTIIVLGEAFVKVIGSASETDLGMGALLTGGLGLIVVAALWWIYFDDVADASIVPPSRLRGSTYVWIYSHLPLAMAITAFGVAIKKLAIQPIDVVPAEKYRWLASGAIALALFFVSVVDLVTVRHRETSGRVRAQFNLTAAGLILILPLIGGSVVIYLGLLALLSISPVIADIVRFRTMKRSRE